MTEISLQFEGVRNAALLGTLLGAIVLIMGAAAAWQFVRHRTRQGIICLAAGLGPPAMIPTMLIDSAIRYRKGDRPGGRTSWLVAVAVAAATTLAAGAVVAAGNTPGMFWLALLAIEVALAVGVFYAEVFSHLGLRRLTALLALRCAAIIVLMLVLFKPAITATTSADEVKPDLPIVVDCSASMATTDQADTSRYDQVIGMLGAQAKRIRKHFRPKWFRFAKSTVAVDSLDALAKVKPEGADADGTDIASAIRTASAFHTRAELPGVLLLTDGIPTAGDYARRAAQEAGVAIFTVGVGSDSEAAAAGPNIRLLSVDMPFEVIKNHVTTVKVRVEITGLPNTTAEISLTEEDAPAPAATQTITTSGSRQETVVDLKYNPGDRGGALLKGQADVRKLKIAVTPNPREAVSDDNSTEVHVLVTEPRVRVLYVQGSMRPEYKFLKRTLSRDPNIQFMSLVRWERRKFSAYGSLGGRKLLRLPTTKEDFELFDVLILSDLDRTFLSDQRLGDARLTRIKEFVERGGALLMLGGDNSFGPGGYAGTPVADVLPVVMGSRRDGEESTPFVPKLTAQGEKHKIFEGISGFFFGPGGRKPTAAPGLPELRGCVRVLRGAVGADVLAVHPTRNNNAGEPLVVLAVRPFVGEGRTAAFTPGTTWLWYMPMLGLGADSPYHRFWGQIVRWMAGIEARTREAAASIVLRMDRSYVRAGQPVKLVARVLDEKGQSNDLAGVSCSVAPSAGTGEPQELPLAYGQGTRLFEYGNFRLRTAGTYTVSAAAVDHATGKPIGTDRLTLVVAPHSKETDRLARNDPLLRRIAKVSDGEYAELPGLGGLIKELISRGRALAGPGSGPRITSYRLYNFVLLFLLFVAMLTLEWILRRRWQLH